MVIKPAVTLVDYSIWSNYIVVESCKAAVLLYNNL